MSAPLEDVWTEGRGHTKVVRDGEAAVAEGDDGVAGPAAVGEEVAGLLDGGEPPVLRDLVDNADKSIMPSSLFSTDPAVRHVVII